MFDANILTSVSVVITCICLIILIVLVRSRFINKSVFVTYVMYAIIGIGTYVVLSMFKVTSVLIKNDLVETIENTERYVGFNDPISVFIICALGGIIGAIWYYVMKKVSSKNFNNKHKDGE